MIKIKKNLENVSPEQLEVLPDYQNKGIGTKLMEMLLEDLEEISNIDLTCDSELQNFYKRFDMIKSKGMIIRKYL